MRIPAGAAVIVWIGGHLASWATGHGFTGPALSVEWALSFPGKGPARCWPDVPAVALWAITGLLAAIVALPMRVGVAKWVRRPGAGDPLASLARPADGAPLCPAGIASKARQLRPSLATAKSIAPEDAGVPLGTLRPAGPNSPPHGKRSWSYSWRPQRQDRQPATPILQSYPQGAGVWGEAGMDTLWAASTVKLIGAGLDADKFLDKVSRLVGEHDVAVRSVHHGQGSHGENLSVRRQRILGVEDLRQLQEGQALLLATGCRPALVSLRPGTTERRPARSGSPTTRRSPP